MIPHEFEKGVTIKQSFKIMDLSIGDVLCEDLIAMEHASFTHPEINVSNEI